MLDLGFGRGEIMHIMDGVISTPLLASATTLAVGAVVLGLKSISPDDIPKIALLAAGFFVVGVLRVPIGRRRLI